MANNHIERLDRTVEALEPHLDEVMRFVLHAFAPKGLRLSDSVCGFASNVLARFLTEKELATPTVMIGQAVKEFPDYYPDRMRFHTLIHTEDTTIDPTHTQFMALVGLTHDLAAKSTVARALYPTRKIAVIPRGEERGFGEQFADRALSSISTIAKERRKLGDAVAWPAEDACVWMPEGEAFELLAGIWDPARYKPYNFVGRSSVPDAVQQLHVLADGQYSQPLRSHL